MGKVKEQISFMEMAIKSSTQDGFDEIVRIYQKYYLHNDIINVNGPNDGGCDIKIYKNKREIKKCVQVTVRKDWERKLKEEELDKVNNLITTFDYSDKYDFFCSSVVSELKKEQLHKYVLDKYDIELTIYDAHKLSSAECPELRNHLFSLYNIKPNQSNLNEITKSLYDFLTSGKGTTDIKNDLLNSIIISILYEKDSLTISSLKNALEEKLGKKIPDITHTINILKSDRRIIKDPEDNQQIRLSPSEYDNAKNIFAYASLVEQDFLNKFHNIITQYNIIDENILLDNLKSLYSRYYKNDIDFQFNVMQNKEDEIFKSFDNYLNATITDHLKRTSLVAEIKQLCEDNTYLNRISASESFLSLYKSDRLEKYVTQSTKHIFIDTPILVYLLCATFQIENAIDWNDPFYRSVKSLYTLQSNNSEKIHFCIMNDYIGEVAGELIKAYKISSLEDAPFFSHLGSTRNTFFNYYLHLKNNEDIELEGEVCSFEDFLNEFDIDEDDLDYDNTTPIIRTLRNIITDMGIEIVSCPYLENFNSVKIEYEKLLFEKSKSDYAISNDVKQVLYLSKNDNYHKEIFITWDMTLTRLRDKLLKTDQNFRFFPIYNPAKLSNKIALEFFNIDSSAITNDIFIYADKSFGIYNKVKSLLDIISPILDGKEVKSNKILKSLGIMRKQQMDSPEYNEIDLNNKNLPMEEVLIQMIETVSIAEQNEQNQNMDRKLKAFFNDQNNEKYIISVIKEGSEAVAKNQKVNLDDFFRRVSKLKV